MFEQLLSIGGYAKPPTGNVLFLYDPVTNSDISGNGATSVLSGGMAATSDYLIHDLPSLALPSVAAKQVITFPKPFNLNATDWTLEWSEICTTVPGAYANDIFMDSNVAPVNSVYGRYGDSGFGNRLTFSDNKGSANPGLTRPTSSTKASVQNVLVHWAMVSIAGQVYIYKNGVKQMLAAGAASGAYNQASLPVSDLGGVYQLRVGDINGNTVRASPGYRGRIRLSAFARYLGNYTPELLIDDSPKFPGPKNIIKGDKQLGWYGLTETSDLIDGNSLAAAIGLTKGTAWNSTAPWLKFSYGGKTIYVASRTYRAKISLDAIKKADAVHGTKELTINDIKYKVRLIKGTDGAGELTPGGEWDALMYRIAAGGPIATSDKWENYPLNTLDIGSGTQGYITWCQEVRKTAGSIYACRGNGGLTSIHGYREDMEDTPFGWRPVLEPVV